jgi:hypothetical protein
VRRPKVKCAHAVLGVIKRFATGKCAHCHKDWYERHYEHVSAQKRQYYVRDRELVIERSRRSMTTDRRRSKHRFQRYGLTRHQFEDLFDRHAGRCAICTREFGEGSLRMNIDHCHVTQRVRGLLCHRCNIDLGVFETTRAKHARFEQYAGNVEFDYAWDAS